MREATRDYLNESRELHIATSNVMVTRGSMMAIYLATQTILNSGDRVVVGKIGYSSGNLVFKNRGVELLYVDIDENGLYLTLSYYSDGLFLPCVNNIKNEKTKPQDRITSEIELFNYAFEKLEELLK